MGLILEGQPRVVSEFEAGGVAGSGSGIAKGSGYPILAPVMDLVEVGVGGGSIACPSFLRALTRQTVVDSRAAESLGGSGGGEIDGLTARMSVTRYIARSWKKSRVDPTVSRGSVTSSATGELVRSFHTDAKRT